MKQKEIDLIRKLLLSSHRSDHIIGLARLTRYRSVKRLTQFFDNYGTLDCNTIEYLSKKTWKIGGDTFVNYVKYHYEGKKFGFYIGSNFVYLVKPNHIHKSNWESINI